jgi:FkbM family methyltransferase
MGHSNRKQLFRKIRGKHLKIQHAAEVGVYHPEASNIFDFVREGIRTTLVEPDPESIRRIKEVWGGSANVTLYPKAIYPKRGPVKLLQRQASTFLAELPASPALVNDSYSLDEKDAFLAEAVPFSDIDDGTIDVLSVDIEGAEWFVIQSLASRPQVISVETHGKYYQNPYLRELKRWFADNGYAIWYKTNSDSVYFRPDCFRVDLGERLRLSMTEICLWLRRNRAVFKAR